MIEDCNDKDEQVEAENEYTEILLEISFHAISGATHPQTIRVLGKLRNKHVTVLIDGGSTHNFIDHAIVTKLGLPIMQDKKFRVTIANGDQIECMGLCQTLTIYIQGNPITADYYVLPVAACQVIFECNGCKPLGS